MGSNSVKGHLETNKQWLAVLNWLMLDYSQFQANIRACLKAQGCVKKATFLGDVDVCVAKHSLYVPIVND